MKSWVYKDKRIVVSLMFIAGRNLVMLLCVSRRKKIARNFNSRDKLAQMTLVARLEGNGIQAIDELKRGVTHISHLIYVCIRVSQKTKSPNFGTQLTPVVFIGWMSHQKKLQHYRPINAYLAIFGIFGCIYKRAQYGQVGCPWQDLAKCSSDALVLGQ